MITNTYIIYIKVNLSHQHNQYHYTDVIMVTIASQITSLTIVYSTVYSDADQRTYQSPASLAFVRGIHRRPVNSPHKWPVTRKMLPFDDVIMQTNRIHPLAAGPYIAVERNSVAKLIGELFPMQTNITIRI